jgi:hypothetical protein
MELTPYWAGIGSWGLDMNKGLIFIFGATALAASSRGQVSALINYPVADVLGHREFQLNQNFTSANSNLTSQYLQSQNYVLGLFDVAEVSGITDFLGSHNFGVKFTPYRSKDEKFALGFGWQGLSSNAVSTFEYARYTMGSYNLHLGYQHDDENRGVFGFDHAFSDQWGCSGEYVGNSTGSAAYSLFYTMKSGLVLQGIYTKPHDIATDANYTFVLSYTFRI